MKTFFLYFAAVIALLPGHHALAASLPEDGHSAVILAYHRVGEDTNPDSNIQTEQFLAHVEDIETGGYTVLKLPDLIETLRRGDPLPPRSLVITFEGAHRSALVNAVPVLLEKNIPFTIFYSAQDANFGDPQHMNLDDLKALSAHDNVTLGILPAPYTRLSFVPEDELRRAINKARQRHREEFGAEARFFSYPFGEFTSAYKSIIAGAGFDAAFGLQSGSAASSSDFHALPRFTMTDRYGDIDRFRSVVRAAPFPATEIEPAGTYYDEVASIGFSVPQTLVPSLKSLSCFAAGQASPDLQILDNRIEIRLKEPMNADRMRVNCTLPAGKDAEDDTPLWRWLGFLLVKPAADTGADDPVNNPEPGALP